MVQLKKSQKFWLQTFSLICQLSKSFIWVKFHKHQKHFLMMTNDLNDVFLLGNIFSIKIFNWFSCWSLTFRKSIFQGISIYFSICKVFFKVCRFRSVQFIWNWRLSFFFRFFKKSCNQGFSENKFMILSFAKLSIKTSFCLTTGKLNKMII